MVLLPYVLCAFTEFGHGRAERKYKASSSLLLPVSWCLCFPFAWIGRSPAGNSERIVLIRDTDNLVHPDTDGRSRPFPSRSLLSARRCFIPASRMRARALFVFIIYFREKVSKENYADLRLIRSMDLFFRRLCFFSHFWTALKSKCSITSRLFSSHLRARRRINYQLTRASMHAHERRCVSPTWVPII